MKKFIKILLLACGLTFAFGDMHADAQTTKTKTGMTHRKKYALIGAGAGAVTGAAVSKNHRVKGAVIGGAIGAGTGYVIGRHRDKKHPSRKVVVKKKPA
ncbi:MAG: glycine zipper domain-containing protein [Bacteroidota bacterium]|nr:glycine zipper domain-containing protein [Bacteroidota bacterium]